MPILIVCPETILVNGRLSLSGATVSDGHMYTDSGVCSRAGADWKTAWSVRVSGLSWLYSGPCSTYGRMNTPQPQYPVLALPVVFHPAGNPLFTSWKACRASPSCLRLLEHLARAAASRTFCTAGSSSPIRMAMIAITTNSSINVNAERRCRGEDITGPPGRWQDVGRPFGSRRRGVRSKCSASGLLFGIGRRRQGETHGSHPLVIVRPR